MQEVPDPPLGLGVSACLLGEAVRYDGGHRRQGFLVERWAPFVRLVPFCPEVAMGLGVPRPPVGLVREPDGAVVMRRIHDGALLEHEARRAAAQGVAEWAAAGVDGAVLKSRSPSCGPGDVAVGAPDAGAAPGFGRFAAALRAAVPDLPLASEEDLQTPAAREAFLLWVEARQALLDAARRGRDPRPALAPFRRRLWLSAPAGAVAPEHSADPCAWRDWLACVAGRIPPPGAWREALERMHGELDSRLTPGERQAIAREAAALATGTATLDAALASLRRAARRLDLPPLRADRLLWPPPPRALEYRDLPA